MVKIVPLTNDPDQTFLITLPVNGANLDLFFRVRYNTEANYWCLSVIDVSTKTMLIDSLPLVTGEYPAANLLGQYEYLGIGQAYIVKNGTPSTQNPDNTNLGTDFVLVWGDSNE